jgi:NAD(P)-dependent dehydrogenase (short-subunit alcohol dehydrogenase family)
MYSASKHAVKGFTDALRMELEKEGAPVSVTLIKPSSIATPFPRHARNYLRVEPTRPPPVYAPGRAADAILHSAEHPERDVVVGGGGRAITLAGLFAPRTVDWLTEATMMDQEKTDRPARGDREGSLSRPSHDLAERMPYPERHVFETSAYTTARLHPWLTGAAVLGAGLSLAALWTVFSSGESASAGGRSR